MYFRMSGVQISNERADLPLCEETQRENVSKLDTRESFLLQNVRSYCCSLRKEVQNLTLCKFQIFLLGLICLVWRQNGTWKSSCYDLPDPV
jgi:hypothetical protein